MKITVQEAKTIVESVVQLPKIAKECDDALNMIYSDII